MPLPIRGFDGVVKIGAVTVAEITGWEYTRSGDTEDTSVMGTRRSSLTNIKVTGSISGYANNFPGTDPAQDAGQALLTVGSEVDLHLFPNGEGSGKPELVGNCLITSENNTQDQGGYSEISFDFELSGAEDWTRSAQA